MKRTNKHTTSWTGTIVFLVILLSLCYIVTLPSVTALALTNCTVDVNETSTLSNNISSNATCLSVVANNIALDCKNFALRGNDSGIGINISSFNNVTIANCRIENFLTNTLLSDSNSSSLLNVTGTEGNAVGINVTSSSHIRVENVFSESDGSGDSSIAFYFNGGRNVSIVNVTGNNTQGDNGLLIYDPSNSLNRVFEYNLTDGHFFGYPSSSTGVEGDAVFRVNASNSYFTRVSAWSWGWGAVVDLFNSSLGDANFTGMGSMGVRLKVGSNNSLSRINATANITTSTTANGMDLQAAFENSSFNDILGRAIGNGTDHRGIAFRGSNNSLQNIVGLGNASDGIFISQADLYSIKNISGMSNTSNGIQLSRSWNITFINSTGTSITGRGWLFLHLTNITFVGITGKLLSGDKNSTIFGSSAGLTIVNSSFITIENGSFVSDSQVGLFLLDNVQNISFSNISFESNASWVLVNKSSVGLNLSRVSFIDQNSSVMFFGVTTLNNQSNISRYNLNLSWNRVFVNSSNLSFLNISAQVVLRNITFFNPKPLSDTDDDTGYDDCPTSICAEISFASNVYVLNVSQFTSYSSNETTNLSSCPVNITTPSRTYSLNQSVNSTPTCVSIDADNVIFDCQNFRINGSNAGFGIIASNRRNITVRNCILSNFTRDIQFENTHASFMINVTAMNTSLRPAVTLNNSDNNTVTNVIGVGGQTTNSLGLDVRNSNRNTFLDVWGIGGQSSDPDLGPAGIFIDNSSYNNFTNMNGTGASQGFNIGTGTVTGNIFVNSTAQSILGTAISLRTTTTNNTFIDITIPISNYSITFTSAANNTFRNIRMTGGITGMNFGVSSANNTLFNVSMFDNEIYSLGFTWIITNSDADGNNITGLTLNRSNGSIRLIPRVTLPVSATIDMTIVNISSNRAFLNSSALPALNVSAEIALNGITIDNPRPLIDSDDDGSFDACPSNVCTEVSFTSNVFMFNVTGFTAYSSGETPVPSGGGDGGGAGTPSPAPPLPTVVPTPEPTTAEAAQAQPSAAVSAGAQAPLPAAYTLHLDQVTLDSTVVLSNETMIGEIRLRNFSTHVLTFVVTNIGNDDLHNIRLQLDPTPGITIISIVPEQIDILRPGQQAPFRVTITTGILEPSFSMKATLISAETTLEKTLEAYAAAPILKEAPRFLPQIPRFLFPIIALGVLLTILRLLALNERIKDLFRSLVGVFAKTNIADEGMVRFLIRERKLSRYFRVYTTTEAYNKYRVIKHLQPIPPVKASEREEILAVSRKYGVDLELARLLQFGVSKQRARLMTMLPLPENVRKDFKQIEFVNEQSFLQRAKELPVKPVTEMRNNNSPISISEQKNTPVAPLRENESGQRMKAELTQQVKVILILLVVAAAAISLFSSSSLIKFADKPQVTGRSVFSLQPQTGEASSLASIVQSLSRNSLTENIIYLVLLISFLAAAQLIVSLRNRKLPSPPKKKQLTDYLEQAQRSGFPDALVIERLLGSGWEYGEIKSAMASMARQRQDTAFRRR